MLLPTSLVGSYPQPDWLIDRVRLAGRFPPRVRAKELWRVAPEWLEQALDDATLIAIRDQERAGLDIVTDGEMRRESYSNRFATALDGVDLDNPGMALDRSGEPNPVPRVVGPIRRRHAVEVRDVRFLRENTDRPIKITVPGPFTMAQQAQNDFYEDEAEMARDYAAAVNEEIRDLFAAGADIVQIDEPYMQARPDKARAYGLEALRVALDGVEGRTALHICFGYAALIHERPEGYSFLPELAGTALDQISIETAQSHLDCAVLENLVERGAGKLGQEAIAFGPLVDQRRIAEADVKGCLAFDAGERGADGVEAEGARLFRPCLHIGLVDLDIIGAGREQILDLGIDRDRIIMGELGLVGIMIVLGLLRHGEGAGDGDLDPAIGIGAEEKDVAHLDRVAAGDLADDARHRIGLAAAIERGAGIVEIDAVERCREAVRIALPPHLAVGDDVEAGFFLVADGEQGGVVHRLIEPFGRDPPQFRRPHPRRKAAGQLRPVDQPVRLGVGAHQRRGKQ